MNVFDFVSLFRYLRDDECSGPKVEEQGPVSRNVDCERLLQRAGHKQIFGILEICLL